MKFLTNLDLSQNEIQNAVIQPLAAAPANPKLGQIYYNSSDSLLYQYDGAQWKPRRQGLRAARCHQDRPRRHQGGRPPQRGCGRHALG